MKRRDLLKSALLGTGAAVTGQAQVHRGWHPHVAAAAAAAGKAEEAAWKPLLFDGHQNETVVALSELIIPASDTPGAKEAQVNQYIDLMLHDVEPDKGHAFLMGLGWLDGYAIRKHGSPFVKCGADQQTVMLRSLDGATDEELKPGAEFFARLKSLTAQGYYTSKIGIDELNKGGRVPSTFGCQHDSHA
jgi:hypothetical protein